MTLGIAIGFTAGILVLRLSKKPVGSKSIDREVYKIAQQFINNRIVRADTLNFRLISKSTLDEWGKVGMMNATTWANFIQLADPLDTAEILGVALFGQDTARVFVGHVSGNNFLIRAYQFIIESGLWKFNNYEFDFENEEVSNTLDSLLK